MVRVLFAKFKCCSTQTETLQSNYVIKVNKNKQRMNATSSSLDATRSLGSRGSLCDDGADDCDSVNVVVRCRPLNDKEIKQKNEIIVTFPGEGQIWVLNVDGMKGQAVNTQSLTYNVVFEPEATQEDIIEHSGTKKLIDMAIDGFSCTIFCYGQTGSGKTHTLTGPPQLFAGKSPDLFSEDHGLIFRSFVYLFNQLATFEDREFTIKASFLEIYNEKVIDLLNIGTNAKPLQVRWSKKARGFFVENLFAIECYELDDLLAVLEEGLRNRAVASHNMNDFSSRSHTILTVQVSSEQKSEGVTLTKNGKLNFVDLAGSEMTKKTNSEGKTLEEANNINKSLMVLGTCIAALSDSRKKDGHIPYRDSKLTKLLADSLAGSGVTLMKDDNANSASAARSAALALAATVGNSGSDALRKGMHESRRPSFRVDDEKLKSLDPQELVSLVKRYMVEHDNVRRENKELQLVTAALVHDQEMMAKENERLINKLENIKSGSSRSPLGSARFQQTKISLNTGSAQSQSHPDPPINFQQRTSASRMGDSQLWVNPNHGNESPAFRKRSKEERGRVPDSINKEMEKRRIGRSLTDLPGSSGSRGSSGGGEHHSGKVKGIHENRSGKRKEERSNKRFIRKWFLS
ncbi:Kinesin-like protein KIF12 [Armadillidium vulgare]|nr:Kinesin-like protein KIF12 [Armadillidium vulgare]